MAPIIVARDLYKCYAGFAPVLRGASIEIAPGEMAAIMGPSGCGKSTMLHILGMLHAPDSGSLEIMGQNVLAFNREQTAAFRRGNMGFVMQASNLFEHSTVFENVEFPLIYENVPQEERWERVIRALDLVHLSARVHYRSNRLSGGEQQRVAIARAMVNNPRILLADEPTGALDARTSKLIMENFRRLCHSGGVSMVMVTHDPKMADYCDSIYTLEEGVLVAKKHEAPPVLPKNADKFLTTPEPMVRGAYVVSRFPDPGRPELLARTQRLHKEGLLSRICSLSRGSLLGNPEGYSLPMAIRRIGFWQGLRAFTRFFLHARNSQPLWQLWRQLPRHGGPGGGFFRMAMSFARGSLISRFALEDKIEFIFAAGPGSEATSAFVAASLLRLPFTFAIPGRDLANFGPDWIVKAKAAAFVTCKSRAARARLLELAPDLPEDRILVIRDPLAVDYADDEGASAPKAPNLPLEILAVDDGKGLALKKLFAAAKKLKNGKVNFQLKIVGKTGFGARLMRRFSGLSREIIFTGNVPDDRLGELYRAADIFLSLPPAPAKGAIPETPEALMSAMAYGCAVIAPDFPAIAEIIQPGKNGILVPFEDKLALDNAVLELAKNSRLREALGKSAKEDMLAIGREEAQNQVLARRVALAAGDEEFAKSRKEAKNDSAS